MGCGENEGWLRIVRKRAKLTVSAVSRATGFSRQTVKAAEEGRATLSTMAALARFYQPYLEAEAAAIAKETHTNQQAEDVKDVQDEW